MTELKDKRLEAVGEMAKSMIADVKVRIDINTTYIDVLRWGVLDTALCVTGADELADFLAEALAHFENGTIPLDSMIENMQAALDRYRSLKGE